jgi:hypothetical protein
MCIYEIFSTNCIYNRPVIKTLFFTFNLLPHATARKALSYTNHFPALNILQLILSSI